jgi:hypothetical protein
MLHEEFLLAWVFAIRLVLSTRSVNRAEKPAGNRAKKRVEAAIGSHPCFFL